jgi:hypothetical protein
MNTIPKKEKSSKKKDSKFVKKIKQNMYKYHRTLGLITIIPVILWCLSGLMHPFMAHFFKPEIAHDRLESKPIDKKQLLFSIQEVLAKNKLSEFKNFRIIPFNNRTYYQVKTTKDDLVYFDTQNATALKNGDAKYAEWLSRYFLDDQKSAVKSSEVLTQFTSQYKYINRYMPVHKLSFDRPDQMEIYVETASSKLGTYNPRSRQAFIWFFDSFHNWSFIDAISNNSLRIIIMIFLLSIIILSAVSGLIIYGFLWKQFKKTDAVTAKKGLRRYHRQIGIWISLFTITFAFSGAYHATTKWQPYTLSSKIYEPLLPISKIKITPQDLVIDWNHLENLNVIQFNDSIFYRCELTVKEKKTEEKSKWKKNNNSKTTVVYINAITNQIRPKLDFEYAQFLAYYFSEDEPKPSCCEMDSSTGVESSLEDLPILETKLITDFKSEEYGFANKRLPVVKLAFDTPEKTTYFIETATSRLAAVITNSDRLEGYSFAFLHKYVLMDWAGKNIRDLTMVLAALSVLVVCVMGFILFLKRK